MNPPYPIYLDYAATTPVDEPVLEAMHPWISGTVGTGFYGNAHSLHTWGKQARKAVEYARAELAGLLEAEPEDLFFTSGGTESNNWVLAGLQESQGWGKGDHILVSAIEHAAVLEPALALRRFGVEVECIPVSTQGVVTPEGLAQKLRPTTRLVSIMHANNETGTLQDLHSLAQLLGPKQILFHTDMVQTAGKLPVSLKQLPVDYATVSAHKMYGPKGIGALYVRAGAPKPLPLLKGGGQEQGFRSGTLNVPGIVGFGSAAALAQKRMPADIKHLRRLQAMLLEGLIHHVPEVVINGPQDLAHRLPGNVNVSIAGLQGESMVLQLDMQGIMVSSGSACHSEALQPSHVILATGASEAQALGSVRFSIGRHTTQAEIESVLSIFPPLIHKMRKRKGLL